MKLFVLLKQNGLLFFSKSNQPQEILFPLELVRHQEIVDQKVFEEFLRKTFTNISKEEILLFLSNELIFSKTIPLGQQINSEEEFKVFSDMVPLSSLTVEKKIIQTENAIVYMATNGMFYKTIASIAEENGCHIKNVVPLTIFGSIPNEQALTFDMLSHFEKEKKLIKMGDFLQKAKQTKAKRPVPVKQVVLLLMSIAVFAGVSFWALSSLGLLPINKPTEQSKISISATPTFPSARKSAPLLTAAPSVIPKESIKIQILNASGIAGQAGKIKERLSEIGFTKIETGNAEGPTAKETSVIFSKNIDKDYKEAILTELKKTFDTVDTQQIPPSNDYDVSIILGR